MKKIQMVFGLVFVIALFTLTSCNRTMLPVDTSSTSTNVASTPLTLPDSTEEILTSTSISALETTICADSSYDLKLTVCWDSQVEPSEAIVITIEMTDSDANYSDWVLGDVSGELARDQLNRGERTTVKLDVDWDKTPLLNSKRLFYVYAVGDDGSTFAQVVEVHLYVSSDVSPTPTLNCGYASFVITTASDLLIEHPHDSFSVGIANEGILQGGDLDWSIVDPSLQTGMLSCSPLNGVLEGALDYEQPSNSEEIRCTIDWRDIDSGQTKDYFLVLFTYPRVNGDDFAHLIRVRAAKP